MAFYTVTHKTDQGQQKMKVEVPTGDINFALMERQAREEAVANGVSPEDIIDVRLGWAEEIVPVSPEMQAEMDNHYALADELGLKHVVIDCGLIQNMDDLNRPLTDKVVTVKTSYFPPFELGKDDPVTVANILRKIDGYLGSKPDDHIFFEGFGLYGTTLRVEMGS